jgi:hypothetical protein
VGCKLRFSPNAALRFKLLTYSIHIKWLDWKLDAQNTSQLRCQTFLDLIDNARWLARMDPRDHVYAFLGHCLAQMQDDGETIAKPDYSKHVSVTYLELAVKLLTQDKGLRLLSTVEHLKGIIDENFPSWVPRWYICEIICKLGKGSGLYYNASAGMGTGSLIDIEGKILSVPAIFLDEVSKAYPFSDSELKEPIGLSGKKEYQGNLTLDRIYAKLKETIMSSAYDSGDCLNALSLTLTAGMTNDKRAEDDLVRHRRNFAHYSLLMLQSRVVDPLIQLLKKSAPTGDPHKY